LTGEFRWPESTVVGNVQQTRPFRRRPDARI